MPLKIINESRIAFMFFFRKRQGCLNLFKFTIYSLVHPDAYLHDRISTRKKYLDERDQKTKYFKIYCFICIPHLFGFNSAAYYLTVISIIFENDVSYID